MAYSKEFRDQVLAYVDTYGPKAAAKHFGIFPSVIYMWRRASNRPVFNKYSEQERARIMAYAQKYGARRTSYDLKIPERTIQHWMSQTRAKNTSRKIFTRDEKLKYLDIAYKKYLDMPADTRTAKTAITIVAQEYDITPNTMCSWNVKFKIIPIKHSPHFHPTSDEIAHIRSLMDNIVFKSISHAARVAGITTYRLHQMIDSGLVKISVRPTGPKISPAKAAAISELMQMLGKNARTR